jgi:osmotically-inducible protein OsmY
LRVSVVVLLAVSQAIPKPGVTNDQMETTMKKTTHTVMRAAAIAIGLAMTGSLATCASNGPHQSTGEYVDDATISTKVRADILADANVKITEIKVTTFRGTVQLSGFVDNAAMVTRAGDIAKAVKGVQSVKNDLIVRK